MSVKTEPRIIGAYRVGVTPVGAHPLFKWEVFLSGQADPLIRSKKNFRDEYHALRDGQRTVKRHLDSLTAQRRERKEPLLKG